MFAQKQDLQISAGNEKAHLREEPVSYVHIIEHDFPLEFLLAGELAQFETYGIPSISRLLHQTGQYEKDGFKRLDDTRATMYGIFNNPDGSEERATMVGHLNWIHGHYQISNDDFLYTLLRMFFNPIEWIQKWGWRQLGEDEILGLTREMIVIGKAMNITFFSEDYDELYRWQQDYRREHQTYTKANEAVTLGTIEGIKEHFPVGTRWLFPFFVRVWLDDEEVLVALGLKATGAIERGLANLPRQAWHYLSKVYRPWRSKPFSQGWLANYFPSYPGNRMDLCQLGPKRMIKNRNAKGGCPFH